MRWSAAFCVPAASIGYWTHRFLEKGVLGHSIGQQHRVAQGHSFPVGNPAGPAHRTGDGDKPHRAEIGSGENLDFVLVLQRKILLHDSGGIPQ